MTETISHNPNSWSRTSNFDASQMNTPYIAKDEDEPIFCADPAAQITYDQEYAWKLHCAYTEARVRLFSNLVYDAPDRDGEDGDTSVREDGDREQEEKKIPKKTLWGKVKHALKSLLTVRCCD